MNAPEPLLVVAKRLADLRDRVVFVGGIVRGFQITDPGAAAERPTDDVDAIVDVVSQIDLYRLADKLRALGFREDTSPGAPICRWVVEKVRVDLMPIEDVIAVVDGRAELRGEVAASGTAVRQYIATRLRRLLGTPSFVEALPGHLPGDPASQARLPLVVARLRELADLG
jgi:hypothetical protein